MFALKITLVSPIVLVISNVLEFNFVTMESVQTAMQMMTAKDQMFARMESALQGVIQIQIVLNPSQLALTVDV